MKIISIHSFRGGTGKSNITANLGYCLAKLGEKVCIIDTDIQSPGIHIPLQLLDYKGATLNDYLFDKNNVKDVVVDISEKHNLKESSFHAIICDSNIQAIAQILKEGYDITKLAKVFKSLQDDLGIGYLLIDTHPGLNEETLLSAALSDIFIVVMRPDEQDYQGTAVTVEVAKKLKVKNIHILVNMINPEYDHKQIKNIVQEKYNCNVLETLPHTYNLSKIASKKLYTLLSVKSIWPQKIMNVAKTLKFL
jgi:MinD-like ATPase involved in chromosome partitioning or flagellar assembly